MAYAYNPNGKWFGNPRTPRYPWKDRSPVRKSPHVAQKLNARRRLLRRFGATSTEADKAKANYAEFCAMLTRLGGNPAAYPELGASRPRGTRAPVLAPEFVPELEGEPGDTETQAQVSHSPSESSTPSMAAPYCGNTLPSALAPTANAVK